MRACGRRDLFAKSSWIDRYTIVSIVEIDIMDISDNANEISWTGQSPGLPSLCRHSVSLRWRGRGGECWCITLQMMSKGREPGAVEIRTGPQVLA
jgi:hypothetical protein